MGVKKRKPVSSSNQNLESTETNKKPSVFFGFSIKNSVFVAILIVIGAVWYYNYVILPNRIARKCSLLTVNPDYDQKIWGTYRSHLYFGLRTQHPQSPLFGMIWYPQKAMGLTLQDVRHWCEKDNGVKWYAFTEADGRTFGKQTIQDKVLKLQTNWINNGHSWTARVITSSKQKSNHALIFYFALQDTNSVFFSVQKNGKIVSFKGSSPVSENFTLSFKSSIGLNAQTYAAIKESPFPDASKLIDILFKNTVLEQNNQLKLVSAIAEAKGMLSNLVMMQFNIPANASVEITYSAEDGVVSKESEFEDVLQKRVHRFNQQFEAIYGLQAKNFSSLHQRMGRIALSNMLGSIGYNYGYNRVRSQYSMHEILYGPQQLLTACPCRSTFPRGFLWDEGFHHLVFRKFDPELSFKIISSWLDTMNIDGWIPREMILGVEAELRVPSEFIVQTDTTANPPMFFFLIQRFLDDKGFAEKHASQLIKFYPRLVLWHKWLNTSQAGPISATYRWRGRNATIETELNPKTLASGFDDYPRATHPSDKEYHLDLRCWMALSARVLARLAKIAGDSEGEFRFHADAEYLSDVTRLNDLHWSEEKQRFCDYGLHSSSVKLKDVSLRGKNGQVLRYQNGEIATVRTRSVEKPPELGFVHDTFGYVSLFPLALQLLPHDSPQLGSILENIRSEKELWTKFGLRSLSKSSPYYKKRNTKDDPPYWRGDVWMNMNYMTLSALKSYSQCEGPNKALASKIYVELRNNIIENLMHQFRQTGTLWEHYDDETGQGSGAYPFTGWSALILPIMAEQYD